MGREERDNLEGREASSIIETLENFGDVVLRLRDQTIDGSDGLVRAASQELETRRTLQNVDVSMSKRAEYVP